jgi:hypothetical protein
VRPAAALTSAEVKTPIAACRNDVAGVRDHALLLVGLAGALRRSDLVAIDHDQGSSWRIIFDERTRVNHSLAFAAYVLCLCEVGYRTRDSRERLLNLGSEPRCEASVSRPAEC